MIEFVNPSIGSHSFVYVFEQSQPEVRTFMALLEHMSAIWQTSGNAKEC